MKARTAGDINRQREATNRWRAKVRNEPIPEHIEHGVNGYTTYMCRCDVCKEAKRLSNKKYYEKRKKASGE